MEKVSVEATSALLIGSWKCEPHRPLRGQSRTARRTPTVTRKGGVKRVLVKHGEWYPPEAWIEGDLDNMRSLMERKNVHIFEIFNYRERSEEGVYAHGKADVLGKIRDFFSQDDRSKFIIYFTGHGDEKGSWVIPVTTAHRRRKKKDTRSPASTDGATSDYSSVRTPLSSPCATTTVEVHIDATESVKTPERDTPVTPADNVTQRQIRSPPPTPDVFNEADKEGSMKMTVYKRAELLRPQPMKEWNDLVTYEDVLQVWDEMRLKNNQRSLMLILECCHSGRWVQKVNGEADSDQIELDKESVEVQTHRLAARSNICIQAACGPGETTLVAKNQLSSMFTRSFVAAQSKSSFEKFILTCLDHLFVLNWVSLARSPSCHWFSPVRSKSPPFGGFQFFDSFDDMHLSTI